jgi:hypothetical protein
VQRRQPETFIPLDCPFALALPTERTVVAGGSVIARHPRCYEASV